MKSNYWIIFLILFAVIFSWWVIIPFQLYLFIKGLILDILSRCFPFFHDLMRMLQRIKSIYHHQRRDLLLLSCVLSNQENFRMIHRKSNLQFLNYSFNHNFYIITLWTHYTLLINVFRRMKLIAILNCIFYVSDILRIFMMSFKYSLISIKAFVDW